MPATRDTPAISGRQPSVLPAGASGVPGASAQPIPQSPDRLTSTFGGGPVPGAGEKKISLQLPAPEATEVITTPDTRPRTAVRPERRRGIGGGEEFAAAKVRHL